MGATRTSGLQLQHQLLMALWYGQRGWGSGQFWRFVHRLEWGVCWVTSVQCVQHNWMCRQESVLQLQQGFCELLPSRLPCRMHQCTGALAPQSVGASMYMGPAQIVQVWHAQCLFVGQWLLACVLYGHISGSDGFAWRTALPSCMFTSSAVTQPACLPGRLVSPGAKYPCACTPGFTGCVGLQAMLLQGTFVWATWGFCSCMYSVSSTVVLQVSTSASMTT